MKKTLKSLLCTILVLTMLSTCFVVFAEDGKPLEPVRTYGNIVEKTQNQIMIQNSNEKDPLHKLTLNISDKTLILDAVTGDSKELKDLKENETIYAYVSPAMTNSNPPQAHAMVIICDIPADFAVPTYATVTSVNKTEGNTVVETNQSVVVTITEKTEVFPFLTKNTVTKDDIKVGSNIVVWFSIVAPSQPAKTTATKVMLFTSDNTDDKEDTTEDFFIDVPKDHWAYDEIMYFYNKGIVAGVGENKFNPDGNVTREEFAKMLAIVFDKTNQTATEETFSDVSKDRWSYNFIEAVKEYLTGYYPNGTKPFFNPEAKAKREDVAYALVKINNMDKDQKIDADQILSAFKDASDISPALKNYMAVAVKLGLMKGDGDYLKPQHSVTRAEAVTLLLRAIKGPVSDDNNDDKDDDKDNDKDDVEIGKFDFMIVSNTLDEVSLEDDDKDYSASKGNVLFKWTADKAEFKAKLLLKPKKGGVEEQIDVELVEVTKIDNDDLEGFFNVTFKNSQTKKVKGQLSFDDNKLEFDADDDFEFTFKNLKTTKK